MRELNFVDRCILFAILVVSTITMAGGMLLIVTVGYTQKAMVLLVCGGATSIFTCGGIITSAIFGRRDASAYPNIESPSVPSDPPPEYRFTWRDEYLKKSPPYLREELESSSVVDRPRSTSMAKEDMRNVFSAGVHDSISNLVDNSGTSSSGRGRSVTVVPRTDVVRHEERGTPTRDTISVINISGEVNGSYLTEDEGLPTYEEAQRW